MLMAEERSRELGGGDVGGRYAPNITSDANSGIGGWSEQEIVDYMRLADVAGKGQAAGPMAEVIDHSLRRLTEDDLRAISVSGALNCPRRNAGGRTASTASSFSDGSSRR